jgi:hypothetical protein
MTSASEPSSKGEPYQDVKPPELAPDEIRQPGGTGGVGDVQLVEENLGGAAAAGAPDGLDRLQPPRLVPRREDDLEPLGRQLPARLQPDPLVPPGDQRDPECTRRGSADELAKSAGAELARRRVAETEGGQEGGVPPPYLLIDDGFETAASMLMLPPLRSGRRGRGCEEC